MQRSDSSCSDNRDVENFKFEEIKCVDSTSKSCCKIMCHLKVNDKHFMQFKVDMGAEGNLLPLDKFRKIFPKAKISELHNDGVELELYNGNSICQFGKTSMKVQFKKNTHICEFYIVDRPTPILGLVDAEKLGLLTIHCDAVENKNKHDCCTDDYIDDCQSKPIRYIPENTHESIECKKKVMIEYGELFEGVGNFPAQNQYT